MFGVAVRCCGFQNRTPAIERFVSPVITTLELLRRKTVRSIDDLPGVVEIPVVYRDAILCRHFCEKRGPRIRREDVKGRGRYSGFNRPIDRARKYIAVVSVEAEDEAAIDHDSETVQPPHNFTIAAPEVLAFAGNLQAVARKRFE